MTTEADAMKKRRTADSVIQLFSQNLPSGGAGLLIGAITVPVLRPVHGPIQAVPCRLAIPGSNASQCARFPVSQT